MLCHTLYNANVHFITNIHYMVCSTGLYNCGKASMSNVNQNGSMCLSKSPSGDERNCGILGLKGDTYSKWLIITARELDILTICSIFGIV